MFCCKSCAKPKCCGGLGGLEDEEDKKKPCIKRLCRREFFATIACVGLSVLLIISVATPWYSIQGYGLEPPQDTVAAVIWWKGMEALFTPPVNGERALTLKFEDMDSRMVKDVYHSSVAMGILAFVFNNVLLVTIIFGLGCRGTAKLLDKMTCGMFKWVVVALSFFTLVLVVLSWTIFLLINNALQKANLCIGRRPYFPIAHSTNVITNETLPIICDGYWCIGFAGTAKTGETRFAWGPSIGWACAVMGTILIFFVFCMALTIDQHRWNYELIGRRSRKKPKKSATKMTPRRYTIEEENLGSESDEERRPLRSGRSSSSRHRASQRDELSDDERSSRSSKKASSSSKKKGSSSKKSDNFKRVSESDSKRSSRSKSRR